MPSLHKTLGSSLGTEKREGLQKEDKQILTLGKRVAPLRMESPKGKAMPGGCFSLIRVVKPEPSNNTSYC